MPDLERAAVAAMNMLLENGVTETPVKPLPMLLSYPGVRVMPFTHMAAEAGVQREDLVPLFGENQDAASFHLVSEIEGVRYVVVYNMRLPFEIVWRAVARELGHIVLGHDGVTRSPEARRAEAMCFAHHLLAPRPVLKLMLEAGPLTMNMLAHTTGCSEECVDDMRQIPGVCVPPELNRAVRERFARGIGEYLRFHASAPLPDRSPVLDLGSYMDYYIE